MIAPEYFNNHIAIEGEIIVKRVPNDTGSVLVWNSTTKKISTRTVSEIVSDLSLMTTNTNQVVYGLKTFVTSGGNYAPTNNALQIYADDGSLPSMTYSKGGSHVGQTMFDVDGFHFKNGDNNAYYDIKSKGFKKDGSSDDWFLTGGGGQKLVSDFATLSQVSNMVPYVGATQALQFTNNNLVYTHDGSTVKVENDVVVFDDVYQGYFDSGSHLGVLSIKLPLLHSSTMLTIDISFYGYGSNYLGKATVSFYIYQNAIYNGTGHRSILDVTDNFPTNQVRIGVDSTGKISVCFGDVSTEWSSHFHFRVDKLSTTYGGYNADWNKGWAHTIEDGLFNGYPSLITPITDVVATKSWINNQNFAIGNLNDKVNKAGDIMTGMLNFTNNVGGIKGLIGDNDYWRVYGNSTGTNQGYLEIATGDDGNEPIYVRQYLGEFGNLYRTAKILDENGDTEFPQTTKTKKLIANYPSTTSGQNLGSAGIGSTLELRNYDSYGTNFWINDYGQGFIQQQRFDGNPIAYDLILQPLGGALYYGNSEVATVNWVGNNYIPKTHPAYTITQNYLDGWFTYKGYGDVRVVRPSNIEPAKLQFGFTAWNNDNVGPWADFLHFGGYSDSSGGNQNLISFKRNGFGLRQWQATHQGVTPYSQYVDFWNTENLPQSNVDYLNYITNAGVATQADLLNYITLSQKSVPNGVATLDSSGLVPASQLPSYVDDVLEFGSLGNFPSTGETGKIYVATDTNQTYRWSGSTYIQIASGAVQSVNGQTGIVNLTKTDVGLGNVDNTTDAIKNVATAGSLRNVNISLAQLNSVTLEPGIYNAEGFNPGQGLTADYHYIIQLGSYTSGGYRAQIAIPYSNGTNDSMYIRTAVGGHWGSWERIAKNSDITAAINALNIGNYATVSLLNEKVSKAGDTMTGMISFANNVGGLQGTMGDNDFWRIVGRSNGSDNGYLEIATADGGIEPIHIRQYYDGDFTSLVRTATLLDESGNTHFPRNITAGNAINAGSDSQISGRIFGKREIIDATALNEDTYYPIPINLPTNYPSKIKVYRSLDSSMGTPSYSHHGAGFWCYFEFEDYGRGWGVTDNFSLCNYQQKAWTDIIPVGYSIINESSHSVVWIRGGSKYWVDVNSSTEIILYPNGYTSPHGQTVNPTTIRPWVDINKNTTSRDLTNYWSKTEFNPATKANALENAAGIGFSSGNYPTHNGGDYPYMYFNNGTTQDYIALATQAFVNWKLDNHTHKSLYSDAVGSVDANTLMESYKFRFDTVVAPSSANMFPNAVDNANAILSISSHPGYGVQFGFNTFGETYTRRLQNGSWNTWDKIITLNNGSQNFITTDTLAQSKTGNLNFIEGAVMSVTGADSNAILSYSQTSGNTGVVSAWLYKHYNTIWKVGNKRGGSTDSLGYAFQFATDGGTTYDEKVLFTPEGNILTSSHGSADVWNSKVSQSQLSNYVPYSGSNQNTDLNQKQLTNASLVESKGYRFTSHSAGPYGKITTGSSFFAMEGTFGYGISTNQGGGLDIMANQGGQAIRFWAGNDNDNPYYVSQFYKEMSSFFTSLSLENGKELRLKGADDIAHSILHFSDDYDGFKISSGFAVRDYASLNNLFRVTAAGFGEFNQNVRASGFLKTGSSNDYVLLGQGDHKPLSEFATNDYLPNQSWGGHQAISGRRTVGELAWKNYGSGHTIFDISSSTTPWGVSKSNVDAEVPWSPSYPTLVGGNGAYTYGVRVDNARISDNTNALGGVGSAGWVRNMENAYGIGFQSGNVNLAPYFYHSNGTYKFLATQEWVNTNFIPKSHPVYNITQADINSWNAGSGGSSHTHSNLNLLNNIDQWLGVGQAPSFGSVRLMNYLGYGHLALEEGYFGSEMGLVDLSNNVIYAGRENEYLKYGSSVNNFEGLNIHFDAKLLSIGKEVTNHEDKVQLAGNISVDTISAFGDDMQLILNPLYNTDGDVRGSRNAHIYIVTRGTVILPSKPILGQRIEIFNYSKNDIEVMHDNVGTLFILPPFGKVTGIVGGKGFIFDEKPVFAKQYDI